MSKAFTKETDSDDEDLKDDVPTPSGKNYITRLGADALRAELRNLLSVERPEIVRVVSWAAGNGDRSENGDYLYGKKRLREIDRRVRFLTKRIESAEVVDCEKNDTDKVLFGAYLEILNLDTDEIKKIRIVGTDETDPKKGYISWQSPLSRAALSHSVGEVFQVTTPKGQEEYEILKVWYS